MKFKFDENLPSDVGDLLRRYGHDVHSVIDEGLQGAPDSSIAQTCQQEQRILITLDLDFSHIKNYPPTDYFGIVVLRLERQDKGSVLAIIARILTLLENEPVMHRLWIVDENRTRIIGDA